MVLHLQRCVKRRKSKAYSLKGRRTLRRNLVLQNQTARNPR